MIDAADDDDATLRDCVPEVDFTDAMFDCGSVCDRE